MKIRAIIILVVGDDAAAMAAHGITFGKPSIDAEKLRDWKNEVIAGS